MSRVYTSQWSHPQSPRTVKGRAALLSMHSLPIWEQILISSIEW